VEVPTIIGSWLVDNQEEMGSQKLLECISFQEQAMGQFLANEDKGTPGKYKSLYCWVHTLLESISENWRECRQG